MVVKLLLLASILLLQGASHCSPQPLPSPTENAPTEITAIERDFFRWVKHMDSYERHYRSELHKAEKKKKDKNKKKKKKSSRSYKKEKKLKPTCKRIIKVNNNQNQYGDPQEVASSAGEYVSVQEAISSIPVVNKCRVVVYISAGIYKEKVEVPKTMGHITIKGQGADKTVIEWDDTAAKVGKSGKPLGTFASATFAVNSENFIAKNITFKNTTPPPPSGALGKQAVAMRVSADMAAFVGCKFIGAQDTLYDHTGRHYFRECYIEGSIDFVFGNGRSLYQDCHLHAVTNTYGALTAQKRQSLLDETGFAFVKCQVTGGSGVFYLGRAWGPFSRVVFAYTYMDKIIAPRGWNDWGDKSRQMTVFYGQYKCWGPGAEYGGRVAWSRELTYEEAQPFISIDFIDGYEWLKKTLYSN